MHLLPPRVLLLKLLRWRRDVKQLVTFLKHSLYFRFAVNLLRLSAQVSCGFNHLTVVMIEHNFSLVNSVQRGAVPERCHTFLQQLRVLQTRQWGGHEDTEVWTFSFTWSHCVQLHISSPWNMKHTHRNVWIRPWFILYSALLMIFFCFFRACAIAALKDVCDYFTRDQGQVVVSEKLITREVQNSLLRLLFNSERISR